MTCDECQRLWKDCQRLQDYIRDQSKRHTEDIKALRDDIDEEIKYSRKLRVELDEEYKYCEKLRGKLSEKTRIIEDLKEDIEDERAYSEKLERKLDKRTKEIQSLDKYLHEVEDAYDEARVSLKRMDQLRRELDDSKLNRLYDQKRVKQLQDEVSSLRSASQTSSPYLAPAYATSSPRYVQVQAHASPATQVHVLGNSPHPHTPPSLTSEAPALARRVVSPPPSRTPDLESDYSEDEVDIQDGRLTEEEEEEELREAEEDASEYSQSEVPETPMTDGTGKAPGQKLRELADRESRLADREYDRATEAHAAGDKEFAKKLRDAGAQHRHNMRNYHRMAAAEIFDHHNPEYDLNPSARIKIDLHHLFVREAKEYVERHLDLCRRAKLQWTEIISGRGSHSTGGVAKVRPAIMELLEAQQDIEVDAHEANPGRIVVRFLDSGANSRANSRSPSRPPNLTPQLGGPRRAEVEDVFESGRRRLKAATRGATEVRQGLDEIERGMNAMRIGKSETNASIRRD